MKKKIISIILAAFIMCSAAVTAFAAAPGLDNFTKVNTYTDETFSDVGDAWYADNVKASYELGLFLGNGDGTFGPNSKMNIAQTITVACRLHSIYNGNGASFEVTNPWYDAYVTYAEENGIIKEGEFTNVNKNATRAQFAYILANALPESALNVINSVGYNNIPDVLGTEYYADEVLRLYKAGIIIGSDKYGTFAPDSEIDRTAVAAIATRMADDDLRLEANLQKATKTYSTKYFTVEVPISLLEICTVKVYDDQINFFETSSLKNDEWGYYGRVFGLSAEEELYDDDYLSENIGAILYDDGSEIYINANYPGDPNFDYTDENVMARYMKIYDNQYSIMQSLQAINASFKPNSTKNNWYDVYCDYIYSCIDENDYYDRIGSYHRYECYFLYDIDMDKTPEMFVLNGTCEADYDWDIYTYNSVTGGREYIDSIPGGHISIAGCDGEPAFYAHKTVQGYEGLTKYTYRDNELIEKQIYSGELIDGYIMAIEMKYCPCYDINSFNGLKWTGNNDTGNRQVADNL